MDYKTRDILQDEALAALRDYNKATGEPFQTLALMDDGSGGIIRRISMCETLLHINCGSNIPAAIRAATPKPPPSPDELAATIKRNLPTAGDEAHAALQQLLAAAKKEAAK